MAKAAIVTEEVERTITDKEEKVQLTLSKEEATYIAGSIGKHVSESEALSVYSALYNALGGVRIYNDDAYLRGQAATKRCG